MSHGGEEVQAHDAYRSRGLEALQQASQVENR